MKKTVMLLLSLALIVSALNAKEQLIFGFDEEPADTNYWAYFGDTGYHFGANESANIGPDTSWIALSYPTDEYQVGPGAMKIDYVTHNAESWGGYCKLEHWYPDSSGAYDWSNYDTLAIWYNVTTPSAVPGKVHLRINLHDVSDVDDTTTNVNDVEYYYSFHYILDNTPGWNQIAIPLIYGDYWGGEGFNRTGWSGVEGNNMLDLNAIRGWSFEISMAGAGEGDITSGTFYLDHMELRGYTGTNLVLFTGKSVPANLEGFTWGQSQLEVVEGAGADGESNALKWTQGDEWANGWSGAGWNIPSFDLSYEWPTDSLKFRMKTEGAYGNIKLQFEGNGGKEVYVLDQAQDTDWHDYAVALADFYTEEGDFDSTMITVFQFMGNGNAVAGNVFWFDFMWTGNPPIDEDGPDGVEGLQAIAVAGEYHNIVAWDDVPNESGEVYTVWASKKPITDITSKDVDLVASKVAEGTRNAVHHLIYPLTESTVSYYYAVRCDDAVGNEGDLVVLAAPVANTAKAMPTISLDVPAVAIDGDLSEWTGSDIEPFILAPSTDNITMGSFDNDNDMTATIYMAADADFLYIAAYVVDNEFYNTVDGDWWNDDAIEFFIGLYDGRGSKHTSLKRGEEPDINFYMNSYGLTSPTKGKTIYDNLGNANYFFSDLSGVDYVMEAKISLDSLMMDTDARFNPRNGMRIPIEITMHDKDLAEGDNGNVALSTLDKDNAWQTPTVWTYTWVGDTDGVVSSIESGSSMPSAYNLKQNYPNPFNPLTNIRFDLARNGHVNLTVYNLLGQKMMDVVNTEMNAGSYTVQLDMSMLPSGMYFYTLKTQDFSKTMKMVLMK